MDAVEILIQIVFFGVIAYYVIRSPIGALVGFFGGVICSVIVCFLALTIIDALPDFKKWLLGGDKSVYIVVTLQIFFVCLLIFVPLMYYIGSGGIIF